MANPEHLAELKKGVDSWNKWRDINPTIIPDLHGANLVNTNFKGANFGGADLSNARLVGSDISEAILREANLSAANLSEVNFIGTFFRGAVLRGANLFMANLSDAILTQANLDKADLSEAILINTNLHDANLYQADLTATNFLNAKLFNTNLKMSCIQSTRFIGTKIFQVDFSMASMGGAIFVDTDLSNAIGLQACYHHWPSCLDHLTLIKSVNLPEAFLRGCGFPDAFIENLPSIIGAIQPIQFYSCFISYSSKDDEFAKRLYADLQTKGVRCWFAPEDLKIGGKFRKNIDEAIRIHDKLLLVLSENSVNSDWVEKEVENAFEQESKRKGTNGKGETVLFPIRLDDAVMNIQDGWPAAVRRIHHIGDFTQWKDHDEYKKSFDRLLKDLNASAESKR